MYYKIIYDGVVIDVQNGLDYVTQSPTTQGIIGTDTENGAFGIVSSDGSEVWHLDSLPSFLSGDYQTVTAVQIEKDEYDTLLDGLASGKEINYDVPSQGNEEIPGRISVVTLMKEAIMNLANVEADMDAIAVDHECRLTMLELGLTDI